MARKKTVDVVERAAQIPEALLADPRYRARLQNPYGEPSAPIHLTRPGWRARWFNAAILADKIWRAKAKGWDPVRPEDIVDIQQLGLYALSPDGHVTRGERGQEVLMMMPQAVYSAIERAKVASNLSDVGNPTRAKAGLLEAAGSQLGDQAADFLSREVRPIAETKDSYERIARVDDEEAG